MDTFKSDIAKEIMSATVIDAVKQIEVLKAENQELRAILNIPKEDQECTSSPWWVILIPKQILKPSVENFANCVIGPFFSRESANKHLEAKRFQYGNKASVYCLSGYYSNEYSQALARAKNSQEKISKNLAEKTEQTASPFVKNTGGVW